MSAALTDVVVLGGSGFIGQRLTDRLCAQPAVIASYGRYQVTSLSSQACNLCDLNRTRQQLAHVNATTTVVVCAGISRLAGDSWSVFQANVTMVRNLLEAIAPAAPRSVVFLSSTDVYGLPAAELPITEQTCPQPTTYYGLAKLACERMLNRIGSNGYPIACLRLPGIYGATDGGRSVVGVVCRQLAARRPIQLSGGGNVRRDFVHVDDLCAVIEALIARPVTATLNVATGNSMAIGSVAKAVASQLELSREALSELIEPSPTNPDRDHDLVFDSRSLQQRFSDLAFRGVTSGIQSYLAEMEHTR